MPPTASQLSQQARCWTSVASCMPTPAQLPRLPCTHATPDGTMPLHCFSPSSPSAYPPQLLVPTPPRPATLRPWRPHAAHHASLQLGAAATSTTRSTPASALCCRRLPLVPSRALVASSSQEGILAGRPARAVGVRLGRDGARVDGVQQRREDRPRRAQLVAAHKVLLVAAACAAWPGRPGAQQAGPCA